MADAGWEELADREGIDYAKTVAEIAGLKGLSADKEADRKVFRREILERVLKYKKGTGGMRVFISSESRTNLVSLSRLFATSASR
jgi:hypothetical protein